MLTKKLLSLLSLDFTEYFKAFKEYPTATRNHLYSTCLLSDNNDMPCVGTSSLEQIALREQACSRCVNKHLGLEATNLIDEYKWLYGHMSLLDSLDTRLDARFIEDISIFLMEIEDYHYVANANLYTPDPRIVTAFLEDTVEDVPNKLWKFLQSPPVQALYAAENRNFPDTPELLFKVDEVNLAYATTCTEDTGSMLVRLSKYRISRPTADMQAYYAPAWAIKFAAEAATDIARSPGGIPPGTLEAAVSFMHDGMTSNEALLTARAL